MLSYSSAVNLSEGDLHSTLPLLVLETAFGDCSEARRAERCRAKRHPRTETAQASDGETKSRTSEAEERVTPRLLRFVRRVKVGVVYVHQVVFVVVHDRGADRDRHAHKGASTCA